MKKIEKDLKGLARSFTFAFRGIRNCINSERNMRIHITIMSFMLLFSLFYDFSKTDYAILILACALVMGSEMMNTSVEAVVDMVSPEYNKFAGIAKDIAAGAVLVSAIGALIVGLILFYDPEVFNKIFLFYKEFPLAVLALVLLIVLAVIFIFGGIKFKRK